MAKRHGRGWYADPEGHAEAAREKNKFNWWPLLALPVAFLIGWTGHDAANTSEMTNDQALNPNPITQQQYGVGAGPGLPPCDP